MKKAASEHQPRFSTWLIVVGVMLVIIVGLLLSQRWIEMPGRFGWP